jgi:TetR/AcrR family transcriptional repressor of nem operon
VHRNSLYKVFGSKRGLYLAALRWHLRHQVQPLLARLSTAPDPAQALREALAGTDLNLLLLALAERAPADPEVAEETGSILRDLDAAVSHALLGATPEDGTPSPLASALTATLLGLQLRARAGTGSSEAGAVLLDRIRQPQP